MSYEDYDSGDAAMEDYYAHLVELEQKEAWLYASVGRFLISFTALEDELTSLIASAWLRPDRIEESHPALLGDWLNFDRKAKLAHKLTKNREKCAIPFVVALTQTSTSFGLRRRSSVDLEVVKQLPDHEEQRNQIVEVQRFRNQLAHGLVRVDDEAAVLRSKKSSDDSEVDQERFDKIIDAAEEAARGVAYFRIADEIESLFEGREPGSLPDLSTVKIGAAVGVVQSSRDRIYRAELALAKDYESGAWPPTRIPPVEIDEIGDPFG